MAEILRYTFDYWHYKGTYFIWGIPVYMGFYILNGNIPPISSGGQKIKLTYESNRYGLSQTKVSFL